MLKSRWLMGSAAVAMVVVALLALAVCAGGPKPAVPMASLNDAFKAMDMSGLPQVDYFRARDGAKLAWRGYLPDGIPKGSVVLVHGSSASSISMHVLAQALRESGLTVYALDMRGHGDSGPKGRIDYIGQLEDDLTDFVSAVLMPRPVTLVGFSAGGGFALRFAGSDKQDLFGSYVLLAPYLHHAASTARKDSGGWVSIGLPRIVALEMLNAVGIERFNHLDVVNFALNEQARRLLTPSYDYRLLSNFRPNGDYQADMRAAKRPMAVLVGADDDAFFAENFEAEFSARPIPTPVEVIPDVDHAGLLLKPVAVGATVAAIHRLQSGQPLTAPH